MSTPARLLAAVAGKDSAVLVPDRMVQLHGPSIDILIYPMDLLIAGKPQEVARARAAMASRLTTTAAHLTTSAEAQAIEDRIAALGRGTEADAEERPRFDDAAEVELAALDEALASLEIPYDEWEVLYRERLQVERDLRAASMAYETAGADGPEGPTATAAAAVSALGRWLRSGAGAVLEAATDERTGELLDRVAGPDWRLAARAASMASGAAREVLRDVRQETQELAETEAREAGEPADFGTAASAPTTPSTSTRSSRAKP
jgi:hypothetical protein